MIRLAFKRNYCSANRLVELSKILLLQDASTITLEVRKIISCFERPGHKSMLVDYRSSVLICVQNISKVVSMKSRPFCASLPWAWIVKKTAFKMRSSGTRPQRRRFKVRTITHLIVTSRLWLCSQERDDATLLRSQDRLRSALEPGYISLFTQISRLPNGIKFLVDLRRDLLVKHLPIGSLTKHYYCM